MAVAMIGPKFYAWDRNGKPLAFGKLYTYQARTNVPKDTYQSEDQVVPNTNPVILNGEGYANVYLSGSYKMVLKDDKDNEIWTSDPVSESSPSEWVKCMSASYLSPTSFKISGNFTSDYEPGRRVRIDSGGSDYDYSTIVSSSFSSGETAVVVSNNIITTSIISSCVSILGVDTSTTIVNSVSSLKLLSPSVGQKIETLGYFTENDIGQGEYIVHPVGTSADNLIDHVLSNGTVAVLQRDGSVRLEQCGYNGSNAEQCIYAAALLNLDIIGDDKEYVFSDTILVPKNGISLKSKTGKQSGFILKASSSMPPSKNLIDTENYDYLVANEVKVSNPDNPSAIHSPKTISILGVKVVGVYDDTYLPSPNQGEGIGVRLYGGFMRLDIDVSGTENVGVLTYYPLDDGGVVTGNNEGISNRQSQFDVRTASTGREGYVFDGPADAVLGDIVCRDASASNFSLQDTTPVDSVEYPGDSDKLSPAIDIRKACHHKGLMNGFGTRNGWSTVISKNRFDSVGHVQVDSSDGGLFIDAGAWAQFASLEFHGITYGFITHGSGLRPAILSKSVQGVICPNVKGNIGGDWQSRPMIDIQGVGTTLDISIAPIFSDSPTNLGDMLKVEGGRHDINMVSSSSLSGSNNKPFVFGDLKNSNITGIVHFVGNNVLADFSGMDGTVDKTNRIKINGITPTGNIANTVSGIGNLTSQDLRNTDLTFRSANEDKDYSTKPVGISDPVAISDGAKNTVVLHNYIGTPNIEDVEIEFIPEDTSTVMPSITDIRITAISGFSVTVTYNTTGGSGNLLLRTKVNN